MLSAECRMMNAQPKPGLVEPRDGAYATSRPPAQHSAFSIQHFRARPRLKLGGIRFDITPTSRPPTHRSEETRCPWNRTPSRCVSLGKRGAGRPARDSRAGSRSEGEKQRELRVKATSSRCLARTARQEEARVTTNRHRGSVEPASGKGLKPGPRRASFSPRRAADRVRVPRFFRLPVERRAALLSPSHCDPPVPCRPGKKPAEGGC